MTIRKTPLNQVEKPMQSAKLMTTATRSLLLLAAGLLFTGCAGHGPGKPVPWNVDIKKSTAASIEVDIVGISPSEDTYWRRSVKPSKYWTPGDPTRKQVQARAKTTRFDNGDTFLLKLDDPVWKQWLGYGSTELLIMANLPGRFSDDEADPRRLLLPLGSKVWQTKDHTIRIEILDGQIRVLTPQNM